MASGYLFLLLFCQCDSVNVNSVLHFLLLKTTRLSCQDCRIKHSSYHNTVCVCGEGAFIVVITSDFTKQTQYLTSIKTVTPVE